MRLPDFADDRDLNSLREQMGATQEGDLTLTAGNRPLNLQQIEQLATDGIDIPSLAEVRALGDATLAYRNQRVLVYLRDSAEEHEPRFHVANCERIRAMRANRQGARYVVSAETATQRKRLRVCHDCLDELQYEGHANTFTVERFYHLWPRELPEAHATQTVLLDDFGGDFGQHAAEAMALANFRCTKCGIDLSAEHLRRFLHVHHKEVVKFDNPLSELLVLCIGCHANQSGHGLMRALLDFSEFSVLARG